jgi:Ca-activated chloride channel family protein
MRLLTQCTITLLFALTPLTLHAQDPAAPPAPTPQSTLTVTTRLVSIDAVVRTATGQLVTNLDKSAFTLREDGKPAAIQYFNRDSDLPLTIGLCIDTSGSQAEFSSDEALAGNLFLTNVLTRPTDRAFIVRFDSQVLQLQGLTSNLPLLRNGLRLLDYKRDPGIVTHTGGTLLFDAVIATSQVAMAQTGRRALIFLTDGDDNGSRHDLFSAIRAAQFAGLAIYSILYTREDPNYPHVSTLHPSGIEVMQQISRETGGREFIVGPQSPIRSIFAAIEDDLRSQYRIGFIPHSTSPGHMHTLSLKTIDKSLKVQSRTAYFTPATPPPTQ